MSSGIVDKFSVNNVIQIGIAFIISMQINTVAASFVDDLLSPTIVAVLGIKATSMDKLYFEIRGARFNYGRFILTTITFILTLTFIYYLLILTSKYLYKIQGFD